MIMSPVASRSPAPGPKIKDVVQVDVGKQRRDHRPLPRPPLTDRHDPFFQDAHLEPFLDQAADASVADPMFQEANQPLLADFVEERSDVGVQYPVHLRALDPDNERIQCVVRAAPGSESKVWLAVLNSSRIESDQKRNRYADRGYVTTSSQSFLGMLYLATA